MNIAEDSEDSEGGLLVYNIIYNQEQVRTDIFVFYLPKIPTIYLFVISLPKFILIRKIFIQ